MPVVTTIRRAAIRSLSLIGLDEAARSAQLSLRVAFHHARFGNARTLRSYLDQTTRPKLHVGCGTNLLTGWLNTDFNPWKEGIFCLDARKPFPLEDNTFLRVFSEHMIEHMTFDQGLNFLRESYRVLRPGGRIRVSTPDLNFLFKLHSERTFQHGEYIRWSAHREAIAPVKAHVINHFVRAWGHLFIYDQETLSRAMQAAGFTGIKQYRPKLSDDANLVDLENTSRLPEGFVELESLILEGTKSVQE